MVIDNPTAIISALPQETKHLRNDFVSEIRLHHPPFLAEAGLFNNKNIVLVSTGMGAKASVSAMELTANNFKPSMVLNVGYAGGTHPNITGGDLIIPDTIISHDGQKIAIDQKLHKLATGIATKSHLNFKKTPLVTVPNVICKPEDKAMWGTRFKAWAIDMESFYLAKSCKKYKIPFIAVRSILDPLSFTLPSVQLIRNDGSLRWFNVAKTSITNPSLMLKIASHESTANKSLTSFINQWLD